MNFLEQKRSFIFVCTLFYILSFFQIFLFLNSYFWDDWYTYFDQSSYQIRHRIEQSGFNPARLALESLLNEHFLAGFRILMFAFYPIAAYGLYRALRKSPFFTIREVRAVVLLFLLAPVVSSRSALILFMYTSCMAAFFVGWGLYESSQRITTRVIGLVCLAYSFDTASLIPFVLVPVLYSALVAYDSGEKLITWAKRRLDLLIIGPAYWFVEPLINPKIFAERDSYYVPKLLGIARGLIFLLPLLVVSYYGVKHRKWSYVSHRGHIQFLVGLLVIWLGAFPYITIGHFANIQDWIAGFTPGLSDWSSRHQLLLPLGISIAFLGIGNIIGSRFSRNLILVISVFFVCLNFSFMQEYYLDSLKQDEIIAQAKKNDLLQSSSFLLVDDQAFRFNARGRSVRTFEWDRILRGNSTQNKSTEISRFIDCTAFEPDVLVTITADNGRLRALLTRHVGVRLEVRPVTICNN